VPQGVEKCDILEVSVAPHRAPCGHFATPARRDGDIVNPDVRGRIVFVNSSSLFVAARDDRPIDRTADVDLDAIVRLASYACEAPMACVAVGEPSQMTIPSRLGVSDAQMADAAARCSRIIACGGAGIVWSGESGESANAAYPIDEPRIRFWAGVPLTAPAGGVIGCLCVMDTRTRPRLSASEQDGLETIARQIAILLDMRRRETRDRTAITEPDSPRLALLALDALTAHVAVLDQDGVIVAVNRSWTLFAEENGGSSVNCGVGVNYIDVCTTSLHDRAPDAEKMASGIREVAARRRTDYSLEYSCHSPDAQRWFVARVTRVDWEGPTRVIVAHENITDRENAQRALRVSEERFRTTLDNMIEGCQIIAYDWTYLYVNATAGHHSKRPAAELVGSTIRAEFPGIESTEIFATLQRCMTERVAQQIESEFLYGDGTSAWFSMTVQPVPEGVFILSLDITERKRSEEELRWKTALLEAQVHSSPDGILVVDREGKKILQNQRMVDLFHIPQHITEREDHEAEISWALSRVRNPDAFAWRMGYLRDHPNEIALDEIDHIDGTAIERYSSPVLGKDGAYYGRIWTFHDITKRKLAESENVRLASIVESTDDAVMTITISDGVIATWNRGAARLYGYSADEIVGRPISVLIPDGDADEESAVLRRIRRGESVEHYETSRQRKDGSLVDVSLTISPIRDAEGAIVGASKIARDVTRRKHAEQALKQAHAELESRVLERTRELIAATAEADRANKAKSEFLSRMSHELRTPLNAILGFGQILNRQDLTPLQKESVQYVLKGGRHLLDLINEVLDIARVESGRLEVSIEPVAVVDAVSESCALVRPLAGGRDVRLLDRTDELRGGCHVLADQQRLKQVLINLLSNAVKYNRSGGSVEITCTEAPGNRIRLSVRDTGAGIAADDMPKLFTPFERLGASNTDVEGTGLGLALSYRLVTAMGGDLRAASAVGEGSTFTIELPRAAAAANVPGHSRSEPSDPATIRPAPGSHTILSIEDNISNVHLLEAVLSGRPDIALMATMQGSVGIDLAQTHRPDLILLDLHLPDMSGNEVLSRLQASRATRDIPVIIVSADASPGQIERLRGAGARAYLTKPLDIDEFLRTITDVLKANDASA
jgi:PAS domain S-box-containing protein